MFSTVNPVLFKEALPAEFLTKRPQYSRLTSASTLNFSVSLLSNLSNVTQCLENIFNPYSQNKYDLLVKKVKPHTTILTAIVIF